MEIYRHLPDEEDGRKEWLHQQDCFSWVSTHYPHLLFFHVPNESGVKSSAGFIEKRRRAGVLKGVSDNPIMTPTSNGGYAFTSCELKRPDKKSRISAEQFQFGEKVEKNGGLFVVCYGQMAFRRFLADYYS